ncbi:hypothetical protein, partial [Sutterella massiliensis]|uniref:hypothetical protein n=1 Tax=Sutterella massiliensis TaxID=1816689 RepID=UPI0019604AEF
RLLQRRPSLTTACFPSANESQKQLNALITLDFSPKRLDGSLLLETGREERPGPSGADRAF